MVCINEGPSREELVAFFNSDGIQQDSLEYAREAASQSGRLVTFQGVFRQGFLDKPDLLMSTPFIIAQSPEAISVRQNGALEGVVIELMKQANIQEGIITPQRIAFKKLYDPRASLVRVNPNSISYKGFCKEDGIYRGKWKFYSPIGDLSQEGNFELMEVSN